MLIFNFGLLWRDASPRSIIESVFIQKSSESLEIGQLEDFFVPMTKPYTFVACNDTDYEYLLASIANYHYGLSDWVSSGWYRLDKGCTLISKNMRGPVYGYVKTENKNNVWSGKEGVPGSPFCAKNHSLENFTMTLTGCESSIRGKIGFAVEQYERIHVPTATGSFSRPVFWKIKNAKLNRAH